MVAFTDYGLPEGAGLCVITALFLGVILNDTVDAIDG